MSLNPISSQSLTVGFIYLFIHFFGGIAPGRRAAGLTHNRVSLGRRRLSVVPP